MQENKNLNPGNPPTSFLDLLESTKTAKPITRTQTGTNIVGYNTGIGESSYDEGFLPNIALNSYDQLAETLNENRYNKQSWPAQVAAGLGRVGTKAVSEVLKMPGVIGGIIGGAAEEVSDLINDTDNGDFMSTAFNNEWIKTISKLNEDVNSELLPVYVGKAIKEGNLWDNITSTSFWATEGADGIGYIASMLAPGAAIKSLNIGSKFINMTAKTEQAVQRLAQLGLTPNNIDVGAATLANTLFEAGSEAGNAMDNFQQDLDLKLERGEIDLDQYNNLIEQKSLLGRDIFLSNVAILLGPNVIMAKSIWGSKVNKSIGKLFDNEGNIIDKVINPSLINKAGNRAKNILSATASEGFFEEGMQSTVENMFTDKAKSNKLESNFLNNFSLGELADNYLNTISSTEGQKAIFLGGILGGGMYAYQGVKQDINDRKTTNDLLSNANNGLSSFYNTFNTDTYLKNLDGTYKRDNNGNLIQDPIKVQERAIALNNIEKLNDEYNTAVANGDTETVEAIRKVSGINLALNFINNDELGLDLLRQHLETSSQFNEVIEGENINGNQNTKQEVISDILKSAEELQRNKNIFNEFSNSIINPENVNPELLNNFISTLGQSYINNKAHKLLISDGIKKAEQKKKDFLADFGIAQDIFDRNVRHQNELYKTNTRYKSIVDNLNSLENQLDDINEKENEFWNSKRIKSLYNKFQDEYNKSLEDNSEENIAKTEEQIEAINNAELPEDIDNLNLENNTNAKPIIEEAAKVKKEELIETQKVEKNIERENLKNEDGEVSINMFEQLNSEIEQLSKYKVGQKQQIPGSEIEGTISEVTDTTITFNLEDGTTVKIPLSDLYKSKFNPEGDFSTEGSDLHDLMITEFAENIDPKERDKNITKTIAPKDSITDSYGAKIISTNKSTGTILPFIEKQYPDLVPFERTPINKVGQIVKFDLNKNELSNPNWVKATEMFNNKDFSDIEFLINHLPLDVVFENNVRGPLETLPTTKDAQDVFNNKTKILRLAIISNLANNIPLENISTTIQGQYKGVLQIDIKDDGVPENSLLDLDYINQDYSKLDFRMINQHGQLQSLNGQSESFQSGSKIDAAGEIYIMIPQANGELFPLKVNIRKINEVQAEILFELYKARLTVDSVNKSVSLGELNKINKNLTDNIKESLSKEISAIDKPINDITIKELTDFLIWDGTSNIKSRVKIEGAKLIFGKTEVFRDNIDDYKDQFIRFLTSTKRQHIKFKRKANDSNTVRTLQNKKYVEYLVDNRILNTNAVVNQPTFQGFTNIYLNTTPSVSENIIKEQIVEEIPVSETVSEINIPVNEISYNFPIASKESQDEFNEFVIPLKRGTSEQYILQRDSLDNQKKLFSVNAIKVGTIEGFNFYAYKLTYNKNFTIFEQSTGLNVITGSESTSQKNLLEELKKLLESRPGFENAINKVEKIFKNNSQNPLNSQENFVPLHNYTETMENKEANKTIEEGYEIIPGTGRQYKNDINSLTSYQEDINNGVELSEEDLKDYNNLKEKYTKPLNKKC